ncbi:MAG TPA: nascent polypeptide-associated complex subunit family protein [Candidatus Kapabacteria bacterium]|nr:nascent polypeptide-associated complex subunit family protein [Candidatus Kapabacteria bacterium]
MNQLVSNIKNIPGVTGVAIFKDNGTLVSFDFPEAYDKNLLNLIGHKFQPIKEILPQDEGEIVYLCWEYENLLAFYYPVEGGWVNIISSETIPMPVFSLTMTAVAKKLPEFLAGALPVQENAQAPAAGGGNNVEQGKIAELEKLFALYLGPASPVIFKRVAHQFGYTLNNIPHNYLKGILDGVIAKVPENKKNELNEKLAKMNLGNL